MSEFMQDPIAYVRQYYEDPDPEYMRVAFSAFKRMCANERTVVAAHARLVFSNPVSYVKFALEFTAPDLCGWARQFDAGSYVTNEDSMTRLHFPSYSTELSVFPTDMDKFEYCIDSLKPISSFIHEKGVDRSVDVELAFERFVEYATSPSVDLWYMLSLTPLTF